MRTFFLIGAIGVAAMLSAIGVAPAIADSPGYALQFDGANDYATLAAAQSVIGPDWMNTKTVSLWIKPAGAAAGCERNNVAACDHIFGDRPRLWGIARGIINGDDRIWLWNFDGNADLIGVPYVAGEWTHLAFVHADGALRAYKNGQLIGSIASGATTGVGPGAPPILYLGGMINNAQRNWTYEGLLDEVQIWRVARTDTQIQADMTRTLTGDEAGLAAYYRMSNGAGLTLTDDSIHAWDGTLYDGNSFAPPDGSPPQWVVSDAFPASATPTPASTGAPTAQWTGTPTRTSTALATPTPAPSPTPSLTPIPAPATTCYQLHVSAPINDLGAGEYLRLTSTTPVTYAATGVMGGLYPGEMNTRPSAHRLAGLAAAARITPLDAGGSPNPVTGKIGMASIGMSNTQMEFEEFISEARSDPTLNPALQLINGASSNSVIDRWITPTHPNYPAVWANLEDQVRRHGLTDAQVQVAWVKVTQSNYQPQFPEDMIRLKGMYEELARLLKAKFPNLQVTYFSSRTRSFTYLRGLAPETSAFENAFAVRWMIEDQINGAGNINWDPSQGSVAASYITWGPYLWIDGENARSDGRTWPLSNVSSVDCTHPTQAGREAVAAMLMAYFKTDETAASWFVAHATSPTATPGAQATRTPTPAPSSTPTAGPVGSPVMMLPWVISTGSPALETQAGGGPK